ncbi:MAG TPA: DUF3619 family protein [Casimicrobiaceae bacterium]|nr:DUF3619 family protein [Casimicrobiaceae bacterium]
MTDRDAEFAGKLIRHLDRGTAHLKPGMAYRLQQARAHALAGSAARPVGARELALAGIRAPGSGGRHSGWGMAARWLAVAVLLGGIGVGWQQWHAVQQVRESAEIDTQLLASDLPIDAYLDRGFQNWLKTSFER